MRWKYLLVVFVVVWNGPACFAQTTAQEPAVQVLAPHWVAVRFAPEYPHGRHTQNPLPGDGLTLPAPESTFITGQAGQGSENKSVSAEYRVPVPDFVLAAGLDKAILLADVELTGGAATPVLDGVSTTLRSTNELEARGSLSIPAAVLSGLKAYEAAPLKDVVNQAEMTVEFSAPKGASVKLHGSEGPHHEEPVLLLHTQDEVHKATGWSTMEQSGLEFPKIAPLFDQFLRDTSIVLAPDGMYYMTGTTGGPEMMVVTSDLSVWKSPDLWNWSPVKEKPRQSTVVWNIDRDGTWMKPITLRDGEPFRPLWAPEIHAINGTFWIPFSVPRHGVDVVEEYQRQGGRALRDCDQAG